MVSSHSSGCYHPCTPAVGSEELQGVAAPVPALQLATPSLQQISFYPAPGFPLPVHAHIIRPFRRRDGEYPSTTSSASSASLSSTPSSSSSRSDSEAPSGDDPKVLAGCERRRGPRRAHSEDDPTRCCGPGGVHPAVLPGRSGDTARSNPQRQEAVAAVGCSGFPLRPVASSGVR